MYGLILGICRREFRQHCTARYDIILARCTVIKVFEVVQRIRGRGILRVATALNFSSPRRHGQRRRMKNGTRRRVISYIMLSARLREEILYASLRYVILGHVVVFYFFFFFFCNTVERSGNKIAGRNGNASILHCRAW